MFTNGSATITNVSGPTAIITASSDVTCNGFNNGWAQVSVAVALLHIHTYGIQHLFKQILLQLI
jgi:hypothetical protein